MMAPVPYPARTYSEIHTGILSPVKGLMAYEPEKTPVTLRSLIRSSSVRFFTYARYSSTSAFCPSVVSFCTSSLSGARTMNVTPNMVSARVVKMVKVSSVPSMRNCISVPSDRPIQLRCVSLMESVHSTVSRPSRSRCEYALTRRHHCFIFF